MQKTAVIRPITDEQASSGDIPEDWTWIQTDYQSYGSYVEAYRTKTGYYFMAYDQDGTLSDHGVARQEKTIVYVPVASE